MGMGFYYSHMELTMLKFSLDIYQARTMSMNYPKLWYTGRRLVPRAMVWEL